jgi:fibronectin-binding autotransporter adhesin
MSNAIANGDTLTKGGSGTLTLSGNNTYTGTIKLTTPGTLANSTVGPLTLSGNGTINASTGLSLVGGGLTMTNTNAADALLDRVSSSAITSDGGTITFTNTSGDNVYSEEIGTVALTSGQLNLVLPTNQAGTGSQTLTLGGLTRSGATNSTALSFSAGTTAPNATKNMIKVTGAGSTAAGQIVGPWATTGTAANAQTDYAVYSSDFVVPAAGSLTTPGESGWSSTSDAYILSGPLRGTTTLTAARTAAALRNTTASATATFTASSSTITVTGHTFADGDPVVFGGGGVPGTATTGLFSYGRIYYVVNQAADTIQIAPTVGGTPIVFTSAGSSVNVTGGIRLGDNTLGTYGILNASSAVMPIAASGGTGALTTPSGGGYLYLNGGSGGLSIAGPIADSAPGEPVTVVISGRPQTTPDNGGATFAGSIIFMQPGTGPANTYSGGTVINSGDIVVNHGNLSGGSEIAFGAAGTPITFNGSASYIAQFPGGNDQFSFNAHPIVLNNGAIMSVYYSSNRPTLTFSGPISGNGGIACQHGNNLGVTTILSNADNTFTGTVTIGRVGASASTNNLLRTASLADSPGAGDIQLMEGAPATFAYNGSANLDLNNRRVALFGNNNRGAAVLDSSGTGTLTVNTDLIAPTTTMFSRIFQLQGTNPGSNVFAGKIANGPTTVISLTKAGTGTWNVSGANTFTGPVRTTGGTLIVNSLANGGLASSIGQSSSAAGLVLGGGTLRYAPIAAVGGAATTTDRNFTITASTSLDSSGTGALVFGNTGIISPDAAGLTGNAGATSNAIITGLSSTANLAVGMSVRVTGAYTATRTINSIDSATQITLNSNSTATGAVNLAFGTPTARTLTLTGTNTDANTIAGVLQDSSAAGLSVGVLSLTKSGVGNWVLTGPNTYTGATNVTAGTLEIGGAGQLGGGTYTGLVNIGTDATLKFNSTADQVLRTTVSTSDLRGAGALVKENSGTLTLESTITTGNTFSGDITVNGGTLIGLSSVNGGGGQPALGSRVNTRTFTINNGGTLQFNSGNIVANAYNQTTAPTLVINSGGTVTNGGTATNNALNDVQLNNGTLTSTTGHLGSTSGIPVYGAWNLNGTVTSTGTSTISTTAPDKGWVMLKVLDDTTTNFNVLDGTLTVSAPVVDNPSDNNIGSLRKSGPGTMILTAVNTYRGDTTVSAGTLSIGQINTSNESSTVTISETAGAVLEMTYDGTDTVDKLFFGTTQQPAGVYSASGVPSGAAITPDRFAGGGTLTVTSGPSTGFSAWQLANGTTGGLEEDHDNDGVANGVEFFIYGPVANSSFTPLPGVDNTSSPLSVTWTKASGYTGAYSTHFVVETSTTLSGTWTSALEGPLPGQVVITGNDVKFTFPAGTKNFARLRVTGP